MSDPTTKLPTLPVLPGLSNLRHFDVGFPAELMSSRVNSIQDDCVRLRNALDAWMIERTNLIDGCLKDNYNQDAVAQFRDGWHSVHTLRATVDLMVSHTQSLHHHHDKVRNIRSIPGAMLLDEVDGIKSMNRDIAGISVHYDRIACSVRTWLSTSKHDIFSAEHQSNV
jgi:hypothetical protein